MTPAPASLTSYPPRLQCPGEHAPAPVPSLCAQHSARGRVSAFSRPPYTVAHRLAPLAGAISGDRHLHAASSSASTSLSSSSPHALTHLLRAVLNNEASTSAQPSNTACHSPLTVTDTLTAGVTPRPHVVRSAGERPGAAPGSSRATRRRHAHLHVYPPGGLAA